MQEVKMTVLKKVLSIFVILSFFLLLSSNSFAAQTTSSKASLININTAGVNQFVKLPRVGEKVAQRIIDFRKKNGKFKRIQDLMKVKGIGEKTFNRLKNLITV